MTNLKNGSGEVKRLAELYPRAKSFSGFIGARGHMRAITMANHSACKYNHETNWQGGAVIWQDL